MTKSAFAAFLILSIGLTPTAYPLLPRHLTARRDARRSASRPSSSRSRRAAARSSSTAASCASVARFAVPAGTAAGLGVLSSYLFALNVLDLGRSSSPHGRDDVLVARRPLPDPRARGTRTLTGRISVSASASRLLGVYTLVLIGPGGRNFFDLALAALPASFAGAALAAVLLWLTDDRFVPAINAAPSGEGS